MGSSEISHALGVFGSWPRVFSFEEVFDYLDSDLPSREVRSALIRSRRVILLDPYGAANARFISEQALFRWFAEMSLRLSTDLQGLTRRDLLHSLVAVLGGGQFNDLPESVAKFGAKYGFCLPSGLPGRLAFPIASVLSFAPPAAGRQVITDLGDPTTRRSAMRQSLRHWVEIALAKLPQRSSEVVQRREGLFGISSCQTLEEIGVGWGVTRERVRQVEAKAWKRLLTHRRQTALLMALVCDIMKRRGSLLDDLAWPDHLEREFLAKCTGVPRASFPELGLALVTEPSDSLGEIRAARRLPDDLDDEVLTSHLAETFPNVGYSDLSLLTERLIRFRRTRLTGAQRVYLALREIGRPAHFSAIADEHNLLFPDRRLEDRNAHATLDRAGHGIVWIGVRGTYALREWGYEKPSAPLFDEVAEIVARFYQATHRPVPFAAIASEIGNYRKVVRPASLSIATYLNPRVRQVSAGCFVPREPEEDMGDIDAGELDKILREFETGCA